MTISLVVILGIIVIAMCKWSKLTVGAAIVCTLFGVFLAATPLGDPARDGTTTVASAIGQAARALGS